MSFISKFTKRFTVKPFASRFANLKIRTKVSAGFGFVLIMLAIGGATAVMSIGTISSDFDIFLKSTQAVKVADTIETSLQRLRRHTAQFAFTGNAEEEAKARQAAKETKAAADEALGLITSPELRKSIEDVAARLADYMALFDKVVELRIKQDTMMEEVIKNTGSQLQSDFEQMGEVAAGTGDSNLQTLTLSGTKGLMAALLNAKDALGEHSMLAFKKTEIAFTELQESLERIKSATENAEMKSLADNISQQTATYFDGFKRAMNHTIEINRLIHGDMTHNGELIDEITEVMKTGVKEDEKSIVAEVRSIISSSKTTNVALMVSGLTLGMAFAWLIGSGIARPVIAMTGTMRTLANGDTKIEIPGVERKDEIGQMAATVQVFRDNMVKAEQLTADQLAEQERKEQRQKAVEDHIAHFESSIASALDTLANASTELQSTANAMSTTAEHTQQQSTTVAAASEQATSNVQTVASAADELSSSITEINRHVSQSTEITGQAVEEASATDAKVQRLAEAASKIGDVVELISDIASQTNLLALNATIEAARAGEAGKGFAVVASEVKSLATQTAKATEEISTLIAAIQGETQDSVESIKSIGKTIGDVNSITTTIAAAVEEQGAATQEIARNVQQAAEGTGEVASNIGGVQEAAAQTGAAATQVLASATDLAKQAETLRADVDSFLTNIRAA